MDPQQLLSLVRSGCCTNEAVAGVAGVIDGVDERGQGAELENRRRGR